jgi:hypothetical protein
MLLQSIQCLRDAVRSKVSGSGNGDAPKKTDPPGDQARVLKRANAYRAVDAGLNKIDGSVTEAKRDLHIRVMRLKVE